MATPVVVQVRRIRRAPSHLQDLPLPRYQTEGAAGLDLHADLPCDTVLQPFERRAVPTGIALRLPPGYEAQVRSRSGLALEEGLVVLNQPWGTIDADYGEEVMVLLCNISLEPRLLRRGQRVAQLVVAPVAAVELAEVQVLESPPRGGLGSTGRG